MVKRTCTNCDMELSGKQSVACSQRCLNAKWRKSAKGRANRQSEYRERACIVCASTWMTPRLDAKYCSEICYHFDKWGPRSSTWPRILKAVKVPKPKPVPFREDRACAWCDAMFVATRPSTRYCCDGCSRRAHKVRRRGREHDAVGTYTWAEVTRVWLSIGKCCAYCREPKRNDEIEPDHVMPLSRGGANSITNVVPCCAPCNSDKRDLLLDEWPADRERRGLPPRALDLRLRHLTGASWVA